MLCEYKEVHISRGGGENMSQLVESNYVVKIGCCKLRNCKHLFVYFIYVY